MKTLPNVLQILSYSLFFGGVTVGPQFSYNLYADFVEGRLITTTAGRFTAGVKRLLLGLVYIAVVAVGMGFFPEDTLFMPEFAVRFQLIIVANLSTAPAVLAARVRYVLDRQDQFDEVRRRLAGQ